MRVVAALIAIALASLAGGAVATFEAPVRASQEDAFPHTEHQGLFPLCIGCHEGIPSGDRGDWYPEPASCEGCHDGVDRDEVSWNGPSARVDNVAFDHVEHEAELSRAGDPIPECAACHIEPDGGRMEVAPDIQVGTCWACHAHETEEHYDVDASCETCHVALASTAFATARIEALPRPPSHEAEDFVLEGHGDLAPDRTALCATCHTRERCVSCHVDTDVDEIAELPPAPSTMELPPMAASYPEPPSHLVPGWLDTHRGEATVGACSTCHTTDDCRSCHVSEVPEVVASLPWRGDVVAPGATIEPGSPDSHASLFFMQAHSVLAAADQTGCATCHVERFCVECHDAEVGGGYHPPNFMVRHAGDAYGRDSECSSCHEARVFCRECHAGVGLSGFRSLAAGYHDGSPVWLLQHGQAARQNLESCASCHRQVDCTRCHSTLGAFKVSPHASDFEAERAWRQSPRTCLACHVGNPTNGNVP
jgi:hypothetical protein